MKNRFSIKRNFVSLLILTALMGTSNVVLGAEKSSKIESHTIPATFKVTEHVQKAIALHDNGEYKAALQLHTEALSSITKALSAQEQGKALPGIDVSGKVAKDSCLIHSNGDIEIEYYYNDELPLSKRAASVAYLAADSAIMAKDFRTAAQLYHSAGSFHKKDAPAQIWYKLSGENYINCQQYNEALTEFDLAAEVAVAFYPLRNDYICFLPQLIEYCTELGKTLIDKETASAFSERAKKWEQILNN